jgi:cytochrome c oxidase subunit 4
MSKVYLNGQPVEHPHEVHEHVSPVSLYNKIIAILFVLTGLTYAVSFADLGAASLTVAMLVAFVKASLVVAYFMHLKYDDKYHLFIFAGTVLFVGIFFGFTMFDMDARNRLNDEQETFVRVREQENAGNPLKVGVDNVPERAERIRAEVAAHGGPHAQGHGGEHGAPAGHGPAVKAAQGQPDTKHVEGAHKDGSNGERKSAPAGQDVAAH